MQFLRQFAEQFRQLWGGLSFGRRVALLILTTLCVAGVVGVVIWTSQGDYRVLYSGLSAEDAGAITAKLQAQSISFHLTAGGTTVLVPADQVQQLRIDLAVEGLPSRSGKGYELFDDAPLGMTPFMQQVNYNRALQSELARTIMQLEPVAQARVHIVRPDPTPFIREQKPTTASVMLRLKPGATLSRNVANGIVALVARSVEGLTADNVTLVDTNGHILSDDHAPDSGAAAASWQLDYRRELETYLSSKAEDMLAQLLGPGHAVVRVTADINFKTVKEKRETYSPEDRVVTKEQVTSRKQTSVTSGARGPAGTASNLNRQPSTTSTPGSNSQDETVETDYAVSKQTQEMEDKVGDIERLTVAAMVELPKSEDGKTTMSVSEAQDIIKQAVGFKKDRDEIKVTDVKLAAAEAQPGNDSDYLEMQRWQSYVSIARQASLGVAALVVLAVVWLVLRRLSAGARATSAQTLLSAVPIPEQLSAVAQQNPEVLARVLTSWLEEPGRNNRAAA